MNLASVNDQSFLGFEPRTVKIARISDNQPKHNRMAMLYREAMGIPPKPKTMCVDMFYRERGWDTES